jgi:hypothetical protein
MAKNLTEQLIDAFPELAENFSAFHPDRIYLRNDSDGAGDYIKSWNYEKPIPDGLKLGKH